MLKKSICLIIILTNLLLSFLCSAQAQRIYYADIDRNSFNDVDYIVGEQNNNDIVWLYKIKEKILQIRVYNNRMELQKQATIKLGRIDFLYTINFLEKNNCHDILLQYSYHQDIITGRYQYNDEKNIITPVQILLQEHVLSLLVTKYSPNGNYSGILQAFKTTKDSTLLQCSVYKKETDSFQHITVILPQKHVSVNLDGSMIDNAGNLYFTALNKTDTSVTQQMTTYQVSIAKDSLLVNILSGAGRFSKINLQPNYSNQTINASGIFIKDLPQAKGGKSEQYLFFTEMTDSFSQDEQMALVPVSSILDSIYAADYFLRSQKLVFNKASGYTFYTTGLAGYQPVTPGYYNSHLSFAQATGCIPEKNSNTRVIGANYNSFGFLRSDVFKITLPDDVSYECISSGGKNFVSVIEVSNNGKIVATRSYKDNTPDVSLPEFEYMANTGQNIHYIYSRTIHNQDRVVQRKQRQLVYDVSFNKNSGFQLMAVVTNQAYRILINKGVQVSSRRVVFPFISHGRIGFAGMDLQ